MNEFGEHGPTRDPALGDTTGEGAAPQAESTTDESPERGREGSSSTAPDVEPEPPHPRDGSASTRGRTQPEAEHE